MTARRPPRWLPASIVLACAVASLGLGWGLRPEGAPDLTAAEQAALADSASAGDWYAYARALERAGRDDHALQALGETLEREPYHEGARFRRTLLLARLGETEALLAWLEELVFAHPALAAAACDRPELAPFLADPRFQALAEEARVQAVD